MMLESKGDDVKVELRGVIEGAIESCIDKARYEYVCV
jgi:hypothetical protein